MASSQDWQLYTGGHLGQIWIPFDKGSSSLPVTALTVGDSDTVWAVLYDHVVMYQKGRWQRVLTCTQILADASPVQAIQWWQGRLWLAGKGLWTYENSFLQQIAALPEDMIIGMHISSKHYLVVGFQRAGIWYSPDGTTWQQIPQPETDIVLHALTYDTDDQLWIATQDSIPYPMSSRSIKALSTVYTNRIWTTAQISLWSHNAATSNWVHWGILPKPGRVITMTVNKAQEIWVGTEGDGVWWKRLDIWKHIRRSQRQREYCGLPTNSLIALYADNQSRVWSIHLYHSELGVYQNSKWRSAFIAPNTDNASEYPLVWGPKNTTASYHERKQGRIWFGTGIGEVGWLDTTARNQVERPATSGTYQSRRITLDEL